MSSLASIYENPKTGLGSAQSLYRDTKKASIAVMLLQAREFVASNNVAQQFHSVAAHFFPIARGKSPFARCQMDLLDVSNE